MFMSTAVGPRSIGFVQGGCPNKVGCTASGRFGLWAIDADPRFGQPNLAAAAPPQQRDDGDDTTTAGRGGGVIPPR